MLDVFFFFVFCYLPRGIESVFPKHERTQMKTSLDRATLVTLLEKMLRIRRFEEEVNLLFLGGKMPGTIHLYMGEEAVAVGVCAHLTNQDITTSTHRPHGHALAKGVTTRALMAELFGKTTGCCKGYGGSMHVGDFSVGALPAIAIVGGGIPIATGCAYAFKYRKEPHVAVAFLGDGATNEGAFHEAVNMGAIWSLPVIYVIENNFYGASTPVKHVTRVKHLADRAAAYGLPGVTIDGNDVLTVYEAAGKAIARARAGEGPTFLECLTYRRCGHSRSDGNAYRDAAESEQWMARDPIELFRKRLLADGVLSDKEANEVDARVKAEIAEAIELARQAPDPAPQDALRNVFCEEGV